jgi:DNA-binding GntR family transcriptional regulator
MEIKKQIEEGHWLPGEKIPTEKALADLYSLSTGTIRKAIMKLVNDGYLYRIAGKGSFVKGTILRRKNVRYYRMLSHFKDEEEADLTIKFINLKKIKPSPELVSYLNLHQNQKIYEMDRIFLVNYKPLIHCISYYPCSMFHQLEKIPITEFETAPIYSVLENRYNVTTVQNKLLFSSVAANPKSARLLSVNDGASFLLIEMLSYTYRDKVYEYRMTFCNTQKHKVLMEM